MSLGEKEISILVVDDEESVRESLSEWFRQEGYEVLSAANAYDAICIATERPFHIALLDIRLPGMDGLDLQKKLKAIQPPLTIILMTAYGSVSSAVQAMKEGAYDYVTKPFNPEEFTQLIRSAAQDRALIAAPHSARPSIITADERMKGAVALAESVAGYDSTVVIRGESGTGKELIARLIHSLSPRRAHHFVPVNCGGMAEGLLETELFGHEKGAFTGAIYRRKGKIELADRGTLFLDEIGDIPSKMQVDLLRVIEDKQVTRLGGGKPFSVDFRIIAATNTSLAELIKSGEFREDLYYRLNVVSIDIPPLRERRQDIVMLSEHFMKHFSELMNRRVESIAEDAHALLTSYSWPGNVRELRNVIERGVITCGSSRIEKKDILLPDQPTEQADDTISGVEKTHIAAILGETAWNISLAARRLGIDRTTLYRKMERYGMQRPENGRA